MTKKPSEIRIDMTGWSAGDWPLAAAVKIETSKEGDLVRIFLDNDEVEKVAVEMIQHHFEMLCGVEEGSDDSGFLAQADGLKFYSSLFSRPIIIPWDQIHIRNQAAIAALENWIKAQKDEV